MPSQKLSTNEPAELIYPRLFFAAMLFRCGLENRQKMEPKEKNVSAKRERGEDTQGNVERTFDPLLLKGFACFSRGIS